MNRTGRLRASLLVGILAFFALLFSIEGNTKAAQLPAQERYFFDINGTQYNNNQEFEFKQNEINIAVTSEGIGAVTAIVWTSSENKVATISATSTPGIIKLTRKGPGYTKITAEIESNTGHYTINLFVKVDLKYDIQRTGLITTTAISEKVLLVDNVGDTKQIYLEDIQYTVDQGNIVPVNPLEIIWTSSNQSVATVDDNGKITAVGAGSSLITVATTTLSGQHRPIQIPLRVVVRPKFSLTYDDKLGNHHVKQSTNDINTTEMTLDVPSDFVIESNANLAGNLKWEVYDFSNGRKLSPTDAKLSYSISEVSGNVIFTNVKAGTYKIFAFSNDRFNVNTNVPYAYMMIVVPIDIKDHNIVMSVGDTYNLYDNSNIPNMGIFRHEYTTGNQNIVSIDQTSGVLRARRNGESRIRLIYQPAYNLYDNSIIVDDIFINIKVIDNIILDNTSATIYTGGSLLLNAIVTDPTQPVLWSSDSISVATVDSNGLIKGIRPGIATITAKQTINGVVKSATCLITVQQTVSSIRLNPNDITIPINGYYTLHALITPANLSGVTLNWKSSNNNIVTIVESSPLSVTIRGVSGGHAVISGINEDNVVVGFCHVHVRQPVTSIKLSETDVVLDTNTKKLQLRASAYPENALNKKVNWSSTNDTVARVDENGLVTILSAGTASIIATSDDDSTVREVCNLSIKIPIATITIDEKEATMLVGQIKRISYLVLPQEATNSKVAWTSTNKAVADVDATGKITAKAVGTAVIILSSIDGGQSVYCTITVREVATGVKLDVEKLELKTGEKYKLKPVLSPKASSDSGLMWESTDTKVAEVNEDGEVLAKGPGTAIIMVYTEGGGLAYCNVKVLQPVESIILNFSKKIIYVDETFELKASVSPSEASSLGVTFESLNPQVAAVSDKGVVTGRMGGVTLITVTAVEGGVIATCELTVKELVNEIMLEEDSYRIGVGKSKVLTATILPDTSSNQKLKWISSNERIARVTQKGKVTGVATGFAVIKVVSLDGSDIEAYCDIEVVKPVSRVSVTKKSLSMYVGEEKTIKAKVEPSNATYKDVFWTSSDESIAIIDEDGTITALKAGTAIITAKAQDNSGKQSICYLTVHNLVPATGITVMDKKLVMAVNEKKTVKAAINPSTSTDKYYWSSDNTGIVKVNSKGEITARATGSARVTVMTDSGKTATIEVTVIGLNMKEITLEQYTTYDIPLSVEGTTSRVNFSIDNPGIAVLIRDGNSSTRISSRGVGKATITATVDGRKLTCKLTVTKMN